MECRNRKRRQTVKLLATLTKAFSVFGIGALGLSASIQVAHPCSDILIWLRANTGFIDDCYASMLLATMRFGSATYADFPLCAFAV